MTEPEDTSTWQTIQNQIFTPHCTEACHTAGTSFAEQSDLILTEDVAYDALVDALPNNEAARTDGLLLVSTEGLAGVEKSFLWEKINTPNESHFYKDHPHYGALMPLGGAPLTFGELEYIRQWIRAGAPAIGEVADRSLLEDTLRYDNTSFAPLLPPAQGIHLQLGPFDVAPQYERELFYYENIDYGEDLFITRVEMSMRPGSHHFILYTFPEDLQPSLIPPAQTYRDIRDATGNPILENMTPMLFHVFFAGTQWPRLNYHFPPGVALRFPGTGGFDLNAHYVNRTDEALTGEVNINLHTIDPSEVVHEAQVLVMSNQELFLPPGEVTTVTRTFDVSERMHVFQLFSHAHEHMTSFKVRIAGGSRNGELIYVTTDWEHPPILELSPPLTLEPGQGLTLETTYNNTTNHVLNFGLLSENEMMILFGYYYTD